MPINLNSIVETASTYIDNWCEKYDVPTPKLTIHVHCSAEFGNVCDADEAETDHITVCIQYRPEQQEELNTDSFVKYLFKMFLHYVFRQDRRIGWPGSSGEITLLDAIIDNSYTQRDIQCQSDKEPEFGFDIYERMYGKR